MQLTQLNSVQPISAKQVSRVELSCVAINGPLGHHECGDKNDRLDIGLYECRSCMVECRLTSGLVSQIPERRHQYDVFHIVSNASLTLARILFPQCPAMGSDEVSMRL